MSIGFGSRCSGVAVTAPCFIWWKLESARFRFGDSVSLKGVGSWVGFEPCRRNCLHDFSEGNSNC